jgi:hypothetical protein
MSSSNRSHSRSRSHSHSHSFIGIDISAKTVDVAHRQDGRVKACFTAEQTGAGHAALAVRLQGLSPSAWYWRPPGCTTWIGP